MTDEQKYILESNYIDWSSRQRTRKQPSDSDTFHSLRRAALAAQKADNERACFDRLSREQNEQAAKDAEKQAQINAALEPQKTRLRNEWLAAHPGKTYSDFEQQAWPYLKSNLIAEQQDAHRQAAMSEAAQTGRYSI